MKRALISGITGQDGSYLAEFLLAKGYEVHGIVRRHPLEYAERIEHLRGKVTLHQADLMDQGSLEIVLGKTKPSEVYNLAAQTYVPESFIAPVLTSEVTGLGVTRMLEAVSSVDHHRSAPGIRFYQASSSEMFGSSPPPQNEQTPFHPRSPYGVAKVYGHHMTVNYRESYGMFACSGILFNHESPRRAKRFVTRKITDGMARIGRGHAKSIGLGNTSARRDWGYAGDYVEAMWLMLQQDEPDDYVIATGRSHSVEEFAWHAYSKVKGNLSLWDLKWADVIYWDKSEIRPAEVEDLCGDASKAKAKLGWEPKTSFEELVDMMVEADLRRCEPAEKPLYETTGAVR